MRINSILLSLLAGGIVVAACGCGRSESAGGAESPADVVEQSSKTADKDVTTDQINEALFAQLAQRVSSLIQAGEFQTASETLKSMEGMKLTPEQQRVVDSFKKLLEQR